MGRLRRARGSAPDEARRDHGGAAARGIGLRLAQEADPAAVGQPGTWAADSHVRVEAAPEPAAADAAAATRPSKPRRRARRPSDPWRAAFFGVLVLAILLGAGWALLGSSLLVVRHEEVTGNRLVPARVVLAAAGIRHGAPLDSVNAAAVARRVEHIALVFSATVARSWPDTIVISVRERTPELAVPSGGGFALLDVDGVTVRWSRIRPSGMPLLTAPPARLRGSADVRAAVIALWQLPRAVRRLVESVTATAGNAVTFGLRGGITVVWGGPAQARAKAAELTVLLRTHARYYDVSDPSAAVTQG